MILNGPLIISSVAFNSCKAYYNNCRAQYVTFLKGLRIAF